MYRSSIGKDVNQDMFDFIKEAGIFGIERFICMTTIRCLRELNGKFYLAGVIDVSCVDVKVK